MSEFSQYFAAWEGNFLLAAAMMFTIHEMGHAVLCIMAGVPVRGIGLGIFTAMFVLRFEGTKVSFKWTPRRMFPHVLALAPAVGWWRIAIAAGGPLAGFTTAIAILFFGPGSVLFSHYGVALHPFIFGVVALGTGTLLNLIPFVRKGVPTDGAYIASSIRRMRAGRKLTNRNNADRF